MKHKYKSHKSIRKLKNKKIIKFYAHLRGI